MRNSVEPPSLTALAITKGALNSGQPSRYYWLDWVRFLAAFAVLVFHARTDHWCAWGELTSDYRNRLTAIFFIVTRIGFEPVIVFFVLSGFLVGGKALERIREGTFDLSAYVLDRFSRIYVPLLPALVFTAGIIMALGHRVSLVEFAGNVFALQGIFVPSLSGNSPLWSLSYEIWFYVLGGAIGMSFADSKARRLTGFFVVVLVCLVFTRLNAWLLFSWCLGAISYRLARSSPQWIWGLVGAIIATIGCVFYQLLTNSISIDQASVSQYLPSRAVATLILATGLALIIPYVATRRPTADWSASLDCAGSRFSAFSYTLYLVHFPLLLVWKHWCPEKFVVFNLSSVAWFTVKIGSCLFAAWIFFLCFESRTDGLRRWIRSRM